MLKGFSSGIFAYGKAFRLISKLGLWGYVLIPALISLLIAGTIGVSAWGLSDNIGDFLVAWYPWERGQSIIVGISTLFGGLLIVAIGLILYKHIVLVLSAPFMSPLSEKVENHLLGQSSTIQFSFAQMLKDLLRGLRIALRNIIREFFYTLLLLLLGLIPFFSPFAPFLILAVQSFYAGFGNIDYTLERHLNVRNSIRFVRANKSLALGNGLVFMGLLAIGIGFLIAPPLAAIAATVETTKRLDIKPNFTEAYV